MAIKLGETILDRYVVEKELGRGGMGAVYRAQHKTLGMPVAVKVLLLDDDETRARFHREASAMAKVRHANVVSVLDFGETDDDEPVIVMEFVDGESLQDRLDREQALAWPDAVRLACDVLRGLAAVHRAGLIHRDLKPDNIALDRGPPEVAKVLDFGIARSSNAHTVAQKLTATGMVIGTPKYMAPEVLMGQEPDASVDVYAVGLILYEAVAGAPPLSGGSTQPMLRRLREDIPPPVPHLPDGGALPPELVQVLLHSVALDPSVRPSTEAMLTTLERCLTLAHSVDDATAAVPVFPPTPQLHAPPAPSAAPSTQMLGTPAGAPSSPPGTFVLGSPVQAPRSPAQHSAQPPPPVPLPLAALTPLPTTPQPTTPQPTTPQTSTPQTAAQEVRLVLAAVLPSARLQHPDERQWLADVAAPGRAFSLGDSMWLTVQPPGPASTVALQATHLEQLLQNRFGPTALVASTTTAPTFKLTPAQLAGVKPMPIEVRELVARLTGG